MYTILEIKVLFLALKLSNPCPIEDKLSRCVLWSNQHVRLNSIIIFALHINYLDNVTSKDNE